MTWGLPRDYEWTHGPSAADLEAEKYAPPNPLRRHYPAHDTDRDFRDVLDEAVARALHERNPHV